MAAFAANEKLQAKAEADAAGSTSPWIWIQFRTKWPYCFGTPYGFLADENSTKNLIYGIFGRYSKHFMDLMGVVEVCADFIAFLV